MTGNMLSNICFLDKKTCDFCDARCPNYHDSKELREIIYFLLNELEIQHPLLKEYCLDKIKERYGIDISRLK